MPKNTPPPTCKTCGKPMKWLPAKTGYRKFRCIDCDGPDPLKSSETLKLSWGAFERLKSVERLKGYAQTARENVEKLPPGERRDALVQRIREMKRAIDFNQG